MLVGNALFQQVMNGVYFSPELEGLEEKFELLSTDHSNPSWRCLLCGRKPMANYSHHATSAKHLEEVACFEAHAAAAEQMLLSLDEPSPPPSPEPPDVHIHIPEEESESKRSDTPPRPLLPFTSIQAVELVAAMYKENNLEISDLEIDFHKLAKAIQAMEHEGQDKDDVTDEAALEADLWSLVPQDFNDWYLFKKKEHVVTLLIIGSTHSILSQSQYRCIRAILQICNVRLPESGGHYKSSVSD
ncbi:hypothetical protein DFH28DRAFT_1082628 [Melampsora americana]|nr:hypothetical protein DFH28DRAFT_1082628 [Melampsora americana]